MLMITHYQLKVKIIFLIDRLVLVIKLVVKFLITKFVYEIGCNILLNLRLLTFFS